MVQGSAAATPRGNRITATPSRFTDADGATPTAPNRWSQATPGGPSGAQTPTRFSMNSGFHAGSSFSNKPLMQQAPQQPNIPMWQKDL